jgi:phosphocarrier protein HPr
MSLQIEKSESVLIRQEVKILNELGLHARPAAEFVRAANAFRSEIWLIKGQERFSAISIIEVLRADLVCGDTATIEANGPDSDKAVTRLAKLVGEFREKELAGDWDQSIEAQDDN